MQLRALYNNFPRGHIRVKNKLFSSFFIYLLQCFIPKYKVLVNDDEERLYLIFWNSIIMKEIEEWNIKRTKKKRQQGDRRLSRKLEKTEHIDVEPSWVQVWNPKNGTEP